MIKSIGVLFIFFLTFWTECSATNYKPVPDTIEFWYIKLNDSIILNDNANSWSDSSYKTIELKNYKESDTLKFFMGGDMINGIRNYIELRNEENQLVWLEGQNCQFVEMKTNSSLDKFYKRLGGKNEEVKIPIISILMSTSLKREGTLLRVYFLEGGTHNRYFLGSIKLYRLNKN